jgi:undecaprenyl-diphosphatase
MTPLTDATDRTGVTQAPPGGKPIRSLTDVLADPRVRLVAGSAALLVTAAAARRDHVGPAEAAVFRAVNALPGWLYPPAWVVMQLGALGAAPAAAGAAWLAGDRELAGRMLAGGTSAWALSKVVKRVVQRPRPAILLAGTRRRGREAAGLGYLSGHAGVAVALGAAAFPRLGPGGRALTLGAVPVVGVSRIYVGAHLPLDVAGGAALGLVLDAALTLAGRRPRGGGSRMTLIRGTSAPSRCLPRRASVREQHLIGRGAARPGRASAAQGSARCHSTQPTTRGLRYCRSTGASSC